MINLMAAQQWCGTMHAWAPTDESSLKVFYEQPNYGINTTGVWTATVGGNTTLTAETEPPAVSGAPDFASGTNHVLETPTINSSSSPTWGWEQGAPAKIKGTFAAVIDLDSVPAANGGGADQQHYIFACTSFTMGLSYCSSPGLRGFIKKPSNGTYPSTSALSITTGKHLVIFRFDGPAGIMEIQLDGGSWATGTNPNEDIGSQQVYLGNNNSPFTTTRFDGRMHAVLGFNASISDTVAGKLLAWSQRVYGTP